MYGVRIAHLAGELFAFFPGDLPTFNFTCHSTLNQSLSINNKAIDRILHTDINSTMDNPPGVTEGSYQKANLYTRKKGNQQLYGNRRGISLLFIARILINCLVIHLELDLLQNQSVTFA